MPWIFAGLAFTFLLIAVLFAWRYYRQREKWDRLLGVLAHELRTPIHGLIGLHFQLGKTLLAPEQKEITQSLFQTSQLLKSTVDKLLHYSKRNQGSLRGAKGWTELDELLKTWKELVRPLILREEMELEIRSDFPPGLMVQVAGDTIIQFLLYTAELIIKEKKSWILRLAVGEFQGRIFFRFSYGENKLPPFSLLNPLKSNLIAGESLRQSIAQYLLVEILKDLRIKILDVGHFSLPAQTRQGLSSQEGRQFALWKEEGFWSDEVGLHLKKQGWEMRSRDKISPDTWIFAAVPLGRDVQKWFREEDFPPFYRRIVLLTKQPQSFELGPRIYCFSLPFVGKDLRSFIHKIEEGPYASIQPRPVEEKGSILLVDDNQLNRNYFSSLLETRGYSVTEAESGSQAQKYLQEGRGFDYLFLDIQMPVMNGFAFLEWLRKAQPGFAGKIVALTADQSFEVQSRIHQEDFDHILAKPLFPGDLDDVFGQSSSALPVETQGFISQFPYRRGVRWQEGLERCNFNEVLYLGLLKKFCQDFSLEDALKVGLAPAIESKRLLHNLQSNAGILGLVDLRDLSRRLEQQIVQDKPGLEDLLDQWSVEFVSIYRLLKSLALQRTEETPGTLSFEQFLPLVQKKDPRAKKVWQQNSQGWKGLLGTDNWNSLGKAILNYNFKRAMELLEIPHEK